MLAHFTKACNREVLISLYQSLIRLILDYASSIYGLVSSYLTLLDLVQNAALMAMGAFRGSPAFKFLHWGWNPPPHFRRMTLTSKFLATASSHPSLSFLERLFRNTIADNPKFSHLRYSLTHKLDNFRFFNLPTITSSTPARFLPPPPQHSRWCSWIANKSTPTSVYRSCFAEILHRC